MNQDPVADPADRPLMPPELDSGMGALRWVITGIALVLLVVGAWGRRSAVSNAPLHAPMG